MRRRHSTIGIDTLPAHETGSKKPEYVVYLSVHMPNTILEQALTPRRTKDEARTLALEMYDLLEALGYTPAIEPSEILGPGDVA